MQRKFLILVTLVLMGLCQWATAQTTSVKSGANFNSSTLLPATNADNWTLYADEENKLFYIDFEALSVNLSEIVVRKENGEIVLTDKVFDLPVNTIYELDFSQYPAGKYEIELRTFVGCIRKLVAIY